MEEVELSKTITAGSVVVPRSYRVDGFNVMMGVDSVDESKTIAHCFWWDMQERYHHDSFPIENLIGIV